MTPIFDLSGYFVVNLNPDNALAATYSPLLVAVSFFIAALAGFAFIHLSHWISEQRPSLIRKVWIMVGALIMGLGVWAMHFVGMIAYQIPIPVIYDPMITAASALPAVIASALSLSLVARAQLSYLRLVVGGVVLGGGIGIMHYTGMAAMEMEAFVRYDPTLFAASILVAVLLAISALWVARRRSQQVFSIYTLIRELYSAVLIGAAVAGMHYTAMSSTLCFALGQNGSARQGIAPDLLAILTTIVATLVLIAGIAAVILDRRLSIAIRQQEQAASRARESDQQLTEAVEAMSGSLALFDSSDNLVLSNTQFRNQYSLRDDQMFAYADLLRWHVSEKLTHKLGKPGADSVADRLRQGREDESAITLQTKNETWSRVRQRRTANGGTVFLRTDVTDIRQTQSLLEQQQNRLRLIMDNVADAVLTIDSDAKITSFNRAAERIFGHSQEEIVGRSAFDLIANVQETMQGNRFRRYMERPETRPDDSESFEIVCQHKNGSSIFVEAVLSEVTEDDDTVIVGAFRDITERRLNAIALENARNLAEKANMAKTEFISHMSHELRTPLNAVIGMAETLLMVDALRNNQKQLQEYLNDILASGRHQLALVNDLLDLSTIESGGRSMQIESLDVCTVTEDIVRSFRNTISDKPVRIDLRPMSKAVFVMADRQSLNQVLLNLMSNAVIHGGDDIDITITVDDRSSPDSIALTVADNGKGIPSDLLKELGQPFPQIRSAYVRAADSSHTDSTGLGLSIVERLMVLNGGRLSVDSIVGGGTTVTTHWSRTGMMTNQEDGPDLASAVSR